MSLSALFRLSSALCFVALLGFALPDPASAGDRNAGPAMATSGDPDDYTVEAGDPDDHRAESGDPNDHRAESKDPDDMVVESEDPDSLLTTSKDPDDMVVDSTDLGDLKRAAPPAAPGSNRNALGEPQREQQPSGHEVRTFAPHHSSDSGSAGGSWEGKLAVTKARLDSARRDVEHWDAEYSRATDSDGVRGQARAEIISKRDQAHARVSEAQQELHAIAASARRAGVNPMIIDSFTGSH